MNNIQWYPGHMTKAVRNIKNDIRLVDIVFELRDARIPNASSNPDIDQLTAGKKRLIVLNKADLADERITIRWKEQLNNESCTVVSMDSRSKKGTGDLYRCVEELIREKRERDHARGITGDRPVKALVCGVPNVGKSTLINTLLGRASAKTGNKPGVTKGDQWVSTDTGLLLLDTPGILWPKFSDPAVGFLLASFGAISDTILDIEEVAVFIIQKLSDLYPGMLSERYGFTEEDIQFHTEDTDLYIPGVDYRALAILDTIAEKRKCLKKGAVPDREKAAKYLVDDLRAGRLGRITLERP